MPRWARALGILCSTLHRSRTASTLLSYSITQWCELGTFLWSRGTDSLRHWRYMDGAFLARLSGVIWQCTPDTRRERESCCEAMVTLIPERERESLELERWRSIHVAAILGLQKDREDGARCLDTDSDPGSGWFSVLCRRGWIGAGMIPGPLNWETCNKNLFLSLQTFMLFWYKAASRLTLVTEVLYLWCLNVCAMSPSFCHYVRFKYSHETFSEWVWALGDIQACLQPDFW